MSALADVLLLNALAAALLALVAAPIGALTRRPGFVHGLGVLVLIRLFAPPLVEVGVVPTWRPAALREPAAVAAPRPPVPLEIVAPLAAPIQPFVSPWRRVAGTLWVTGALAAFILAVVRARRFAALLRGTRPAPGELRARADRLAAAMGLGRSPEILVVPARLSPMLWPRPSGVVLLLPAALLDRLDPGEQDSLLAHELAHVRRRDHWVRHLELVATIAFWWHPVVWWTRRRLRLAEEQCCDERSVAALGGDPRVYARALLKTAEFLCGARIATPSLASGADSAMALKERLTMILHSRAPLPLTRTRLAATLAVAALALGLFPTWADREPEVPGTPAPAAGRIEPAPGELRREILALERQAAELEARLRELRARQADLERSFHERASVAESDRLREEAGRAAERMAADLDRERQLRELELSLRQAAIESAQLEAAGVHERVAELAAAHADRAEEDRLARAERLEAELLEHEQRIRELLLELEQRRATVR